MTEEIIEQYLEHHLKPKSNDDFKMELENKTRCLDDASPDIQSVIQTNRLWPVVSRLRSVIALARLFKATPTRAVWCSFFDTRKQSWSKARLLLATKTELTAEEILRQYARHWCIKPLFHYLNAGGMSQPR